MSYSSTHMTQVSYLSTHVVCVSLPLAILHFLVNHTHIILEEALILVGLDIQLLLNKFYHPKFLVVKDISVQTKRRIRGTVSKHSG